MRLDMLVTPALGLLGFTTTVSALQRPLPLVRRSDVTDGGHKAEYASIPIDHNDTSVGTYQNRYWVNEEHYTPGGPVFVIASGESSGQGIADHLVFNSSGSFGDLLKEFHGMGLVWEHRYYGDSFPFPIQQDPAPEHMKYLTVSQALADLPHFAKTFSRDNFNDIDLTPKKTPWIMIGGSYSGMLAAFTRNEYPDTIFASFASSAPVQARIDMSAYFEPIYRGMVADGLEACTKDVHAAMEYIDEQLSNDETAASIKQLFLGPEAEKNSNGDFADALSYFYYGFQSIGVQDHPFGVKAWCTYLETDPDTNQTAGPEGMAPSRGGQYVAERLASWPNFVSLVNDADDEMNCKGIDETKPLSCDLGKPAVEPLLISWYWQYCTELGYYQTSNVGPHQLLPKYNDVEYQQEVCNRQFPTAIKSGQFPSKPQVDAVNAEHGGWTIRPSNVYWTEGEFDPWRTLSPFSTEDFAPKGVKYTTDIPKCGVQTAQDTLFGYILEDKEHVADVGIGGTVDTTTKTSWNIFKAALHEWLRCFEGQKKGDSA
ncbi:hypothetical protein SI65_02368 [Aspergillus cristatus]|uniref:Thymus-specific serine protease n=1 Tax=Aspergillus cristatus TaxID=573508 RepID=A0A1E3BKQ0_ASPCR|nr:hypothetical protein SI65_02368 [Aspergillus cristatus]